MNENVKDLFDSTLSTEEKLQILDLAVSFGKLIGWALEIKDLKAPEMLPGLSSQGLSFRSDKVRLVMQWQSIMSLAEVFIAASDAIKKVKSVCPDLTIFDGIDEFLSQEELKSFSENLAKESANKQEKPERKKLH